ncbi:MAG: metallophosphoesterase [Deltaproteobacteria bacterium]|nr:metallophosphoesterase [Deltaproteobacteria bacterium]
MKIIAFGDIHEKITNLDLLSHKISEADLLLITGDLTQFGGLKTAAPVIEKLRSLNPNTLMQAGNLDHPEVEGYLEALGISLHGRGHVLGEIGIFGCGGGNPSPFNTPNEFAEEEIAQILKSGFESVRDCPVKIMVPHAPPYDTKVDIVNNGLHVGSKAVRDFIEKYEPRLCLCGHIHEAAGEDYVGKTHIINAGPFFEGGFVVADYTSAKLTAGLRFVT